MNLHTAPSCEHKYQVAEGCLGFDHVNRLLDVVMFREFFLRSIVQTVLK